MMDVPLAQVEVPIDEGVNALNTFADANGVVALVVLIITVAAIVALRYLTKRDAAANELEQKRLEFESKRAQSMTDILTKANETNERLANIQEAQGKAIEQRLKEVNETQLMLASLEQDTSQKLTAFAQVTYKQNSAVVDLITASSAQVRQDVKEDVRVMIEQQTQEQEKRLETFADKITKRITDAVRGAILEVLREMQAARNAEQKTNTPNNETKTEEENV